MTTLAVLYKHLLVSSGHPTGFVDPLLFDESLQPADDQRPLNRHLVGRCGPYVSHGCQSPHTEFDVSS